MICHQECINDSEVGGMIEFKFRASHKVTLGCLIIEQLQSSKRHVLLPPLTIDTMTTTRTVAEQECDSPKIP